MSAVLEVKNLTKVFSLGSLFSRLRIKAVDQISFTVEARRDFYFSGRKWLWENYYRPNDSGF